MRLALIIALTEDRKDARVIAEPLPQDEQVKAFKDLIHGGSPPDDAFPVIELWTARGVDRRHTFKPDRAAKARAEAEAQAAAEAKTKADADAKAKAEGKAKAKADAEKIETKLAE